MNPPLQAWGLSGPAVRLNDGLINLTYLVGQDYVLQRLNTDIFVPEVHEDIEAITAHLERSGVPTPRLVRTQRGTLWHSDDSGVWRLLTRVGNRTLHKLTSPEEARSAGELIGRFHSRLADLDWEFRSVRPGAHDTQAHFDALLEALRAHPTHRLFHETEAVAMELIASWQRWRGPTGLPERIVHGDLKISNVRFIDDTAHALVDLDTLAWGTLDVELGDALRSWCNRASEDSEDAQLDIDVFAAALAGWSTTGRASELEQASLIPGLHRICLELAARFARDALEERYFGFDPERGQGEHNLLRARGQASLARLVLDQTPRLTQVLTDLGWSTERP